MYICTVRSYYEEKYVSVGQTQEYIRKSFEQINFFIDLRTCVTGYMLYAFYAMYYYPSASNNIKNVLIIQKRSLHKDTALP